MTIKTVFSASVIAAAMMAPAHAATISQTIGDGETFCESAGNLSSTASCTAQTTMDLGQIGSGGDLTFVGSGTLIGFLADRQGTDDRFADEATITLARDSVLSVELFDTDNAFDSVVSFDGATGVVDASNTSFSFGLVSAGTYTFFIDATNPVNSGTRNESAYTFDVAAVPLPAALPLLLAGLGGLGVASRRKRKAA